MRNSRYTRAFFCSILILLSLAIAAYGHDNLRVARITAMKGDVKIIKEGNTKIYKASKNMGLAKGTTIITGNSSSATLEMEIDKQVIIGSDTKVLMSELTKSINNKSTKTTLSLMDGKVLVNIKKKLDKDSKFEIKTPTAILGVRGTRFYVDCSGSETQLSVLEGTVLATNYGIKRNPDGSVTRKEIQLPVGVNQETRFNSTILSREDVIIDAVKLEGFELFALEAIQKDTKGIPPQIIEDLDEIIKSKKQQRQPINRSQPAPEDQGDSELPKPDHTMKRH